MIEAAMLVHTSLEQTISAFPVFGISGSFRQPRPFSIHRELLTRRDLGNAGARMHFGLCFDHPKRWAEMAFGEVRLDKYRQVGMGPTNRRHGYLAS
jgi:hypothetical protein